MFPPIPNHSSFSIEFPGWQPFPPSSPGCGESFLTGVGGEITSPGYPNPYQPNTQCVWMIRVAYDMKIVLNFIVLDLGQSSKYEWGQSRYEACVMSCHVMSCHVMSCHVMSCHVMSCHVMSCHVMSCHVMSCHVMSCHVMSCHVMSCHVMSCHVMSCHVMSCHVM